MNFSDLLRISTYTILLCVAQFSFSSVETDGRSLQVESVTSRSESFWNTQTSIEIDQNMNNVNEHQSITANTSVHNNRFSEPQINASITSPDDLHLTNSKVDGGIKSETTTQSGINQGYLIRIHDWESVQVDENTSTQFGVSLRAKPSGDVQIAISQFTTAGLSHTQTNPLTFSPSNYSISQAVTVTATDDANTVHEREDITLTASGAEYDGSTKSLPVQVFDDDVSGPKIMTNPDRSMNVVSRGDGSDTHEFEVWLSEQPSATVTVTMSRFDNPDVTVTGQGTLEFTPDNYSIRQTIDIKVSKDPGSDDESAHTILTASSGGYDGVSQPYRILIQDEYYEYEKKLRHDTGQPYYAHEVVEEGETFRLPFFFESFESVPTDGVDIFVDWYTSETREVPIRFLGPTVTWDCSEPTSSVEIDPKTLNFTRFNYTDGDQAVIITAKEDNNSDDEYLCLEIKSKPKLDQYGQESLKNVYILIDDKDDVNGEIAVEFERGTCVNGQYNRNVRQPNDPFRIKEDCKSPLDLSVSLTRDPKGKVTIQVPQFDNEDLKVQRRNLIFEKADTPQRLRITVYKDGTADDEMGSITLFAQGGGYDDKREDITVEIQDVDKLELISPNQIFVTEGDEKGKDFNVSLSAQPTDDVTVTIIPELTNSDLSRSPNTLMFTPDSYNVPQSVKVTAAEDLNTDNKTETLRMTANGGGYREVTKKVIVNIKDMPTIENKPKVTLHLTPDSISEFDNFTTVTATLDRASSKGTVVEISAMLVPHDDIDDSIGHYVLSGDDKNEKEGPKLTIEAGATTSTGLVTIHGAYDPAFGPPTKKIAVSGRILDESGVDSHHVDAPDPVTLIINDYKPKVTLHLSPASISENKKSTTVTAKLELHSNEETVVEISATPVSPATAGDFTLSDDKTLTIAPKGKQSTGNVTITAVNNEIFGPPTKEITVSGTPNDHVTGPEDVFLTITDDDVDGEIQAPSTFIINEGEEGELQIALTSIPSGEVTVTITGQSGTDLSLSHSSLSFTEKNYNKVQTINLIAEEEVGVEEDYADDMVTLTFQATGGGYNDSHATDVTIKDNDKAPLPLPPTVTLSATPKTVIEGKSTTLTATLSGTLTTDVLITLEDEHIDTEPSDYYFPSKSFTIFAGDLEGSGELRTENDLVAEPGEEFLVRLLKPEGIDLEDPHEVRITIEDDNDTPPPVEVTLAVTPPRVNEGKDVTVTVTLKEKLYRPVTIPLIYPSDGTTASIHKDYIPVDQLIIPAGQTSKSSPIRTTWDFEEEGEETFTVALGDLPFEVSGGRPLFRDVTIFDSPQQQPEVFLSADRRRIREGEQVTVTLHLSSPLPDAVILPLTLTNGTASSEDYRWLGSTRLEIPSGASKAEIIILAEEDDFLEGDETFTIALDDVPSFVALGTPSDIEITIVDTNEATIEAPPLVELLEGEQKKISVALRAVPSREVSITITGQPGTDLGVEPTTLTFSSLQAQEVTLTAGQDDDGIPDEITLLLTAYGGAYSGVTHRIQVHVKDDDKPGIRVPPEITIPERHTRSLEVRLTQQPTAEVTITMTGYVGTDLRLLSAPQLTFAPSNWNESQSVALMAQKDLDAEAEEPIPLLLFAFGGGYHGVEETVMVTITETDQKGLIAEPRIRMEEGSSAEFTVSLHSQPQGEVTVEISGHEGSDVRLPTSSLTFHRANRYAPQSVPIRAEIDADHVDDQVLLTLRARGGGYDGQQMQVVVEILDKGPPRITIYGNQASEDAGVIELPIELSYAIEEAVTVQYKTQEQAGDQAATAAEDYTASRGIVIFDPRTTRGIIQLELTDDEIPEGTETFMVLLSNASPNAIIARNSATATILDDDGGIPTLTIEDAVAHEDAPVVTFHIHVSPPSLHPVSVRYRTEDGTATAGQDYQARSGWVTLAPGSVQTTIEVPLLPQEGNPKRERFYVHLESSETVQMDKSVATAVLEKEGERAQAALTAFAARFARTLSVQLVEAVQERLHPSGSTCSAAQRAEMVQRWQWTPSLGELLSGCQVSETSGSVGVWGRGAFRRFHGRGDLNQSLRGDVSSALIGADVRSRRGWLAGVMVAHSQGTGAYDHREVEAGVTGVYPYASYETSRLELWVSGGYGWGHAKTLLLEEVCPYEPSLCRRMEFRNPGPSRLKGDLVSRFGAAGFKAQLASVRASQLSYYGDVIVTDAEVDITEVRAEVLRVRLGIESSFQLREGIRPYVEANVRQDGGDAETGIGLELGGGLRVAYPPWNLRGEVRSQGLVLHSADGFTEWGISGSIQVGTPSEGWMMRVRPSYGPNPQMTLHRQQTILDVAPSPSGRHRTEVELGYGIPIHRGSARSIVGVTELPQGRLYRLGGQLSPRDWISLSISGLAHHHQANIGDLSLHVQASLRH